MKEPKVLKVMKLDNIIKDINEEYKIFKHEYVNLVNSRNVVLSADTVDNYDLAMVDYTTNYNNWMNKKKIIEQLLLEMKKGLNDL